MWNATAYIRQAAFLPKIKAYTVMNEIRISHNCSTETTTHD